MFGRVDEPAREDAQKPLDADGVLWCKFKQLCCGLVQDSCIPESGDNTSRPLHRIGRRLCLGGTRPVATHKEREYKPSSRL